ncbi:CRISPR-associated protein Cas4 [Marine Group I thaumarchaeote SCGC RSA3]|uniref:CRISPR-associated protein Cas4 n=2 Tax=Marine Group I TaxID=905826 RepID=A0A087RLN9_9ARCH|nr:CRISPR-associated protein Cas4 [Marine Group I thaumarchaeote SCGC AAA799-D11]KFM21006.1 CRISPR-associated protein Cas4 [Marine Group I thaumarchaeote SCGC RSA3]
MSTIPLEKIESVSEEIDTPEGIVNFLQKRNGLYSKDYTSRYSVTELVGCQRKSFYKQLGISQEELLSDTTLEGMWATVRGDFLHNMTYAYKWREMDIEHYVPLKDGRVATLAGRLDMYDWKTKTIIDLKTTKFVRWQIKQGFLPKPEHILQLQCYNTMFSEYMPVENLNIVYADMSDIVTYKVQKRDLTDWIKTRIQEIESSKTTQNTPTGEVSGLCKYCRYQTRCSEDGNGLTEKPLSTPKSTESEQE